VVMGYGHGYGTRAALTLEDGGDEEEEETLIIDH